MPTATDIRPIYGPTDWTTAVADTEGPQLVLAGPGTGKTEFLARRVAHLVSGGIPPTTILVLSFSRRAAAELEQRVLDLVDRPVSGARASTFHSFAHRLLESDLAAEGSEMPVLLTGPEQVRLVSDLLAQEDPATWPAPFRPILTAPTFVSEVADFVTRCHERLIGPNDLAELSAERSDWKAMPRFLTTYREALRRSGRIDYGSLLSRAVELAQDGRVDPFAYVVVDELQDTSPAQARLAELLAGPDPNLTVAADPNQSIYSFRGAEIHNVAAFVDRHDPTVLLLGRSFRVPAPILAAAERLVAGNEGTGLPSTPIEPAGHIGQVDVHTFDQRSAEAEWIASEVERMHVADGVPLRSMAVIVRSTRHLLPELSRSLDRRRLPHDRPDTRLTDHPAIRIVHDVVTAATANPDASDTELAVRRLLLGPLLALPLPRQRELERQRVQTDRPWTEILTEEITEAHGLAELMADPGWAVSVPAVDGFWHAWDRLPGLEAIVDDPDRADYRTAWSTFARMLERQAERDPSLSLLQTLEASVGGDFEASPLLSFSRPTDDRLVVTTLHQAKGLEFDVVFIADAVEGVFPDRRRTRSLLQPEQLGARADGAAATSEVRLAEERRLAYTATTRARRRVVWTATTAGIDERERRPSRFLLAAAGVQTFDDIGPPRPAEDSDRFAPLTMADAEARLRRLVTDPEAGAARRLAALEVLASHSGRWDPRFFPGVPEPGPDTGILPTEVRLSPSQAMLFDECPRRYALERRLRAVDAESPYLSFGSIVHEVLERAEQEAMEAGLPHADAERAVRVLDEVWGDEAAFGPPPVDEAWRRRAIELLTGIYEDWPGGDADPVRLEMPLEASIGGVEWTGRADRIEQTDEGLRVVDYKTSKNPPTKKDAAASLQLGYYVLAAREHPELANIGETTEAQLWYPLAGRVLDFDMDNLPDVAERLVEVADAILSEEWAPKVGRHCERCAVRSVCPAWPEGRGALG